ncbi:MAG: N-acetyltransferase family protein [Candidatus Hodarchaeales archaeon]|jgi:GNAT superfamily N-acetyltransferase
MGSSNSSDVNKPSMNSFNAEDVTIRPLAVPDDGEKLAALFNSFNESWEMGFQGQGQNTAETALEIATRLKRIVTFVAEEKSGRLLGYCSVHPHYRYTEACYVGILGVHPEALGKKIGKRLMLKAIEKSTGEGKSRIELGTWPGNLTAMPLYKKLGFNWVPETSVQMEGYIPLILSFPIFSKFWSKHPDWYSIFQKNLDQIPDEEKFNELDVFTYDFVTGDDRLTVWIDKNAKDILGFDLRLDGKNLKMYLDSSSCKVYRGVNFPVKVIVESSNPINDLKIDLDLPDGIDVVKQDSTTIDSRVVEFNYSLSTGLTVPLHRKNEKSVATRFILNWNDQEVSLTLGLQVYSAIEITACNGSEALCSNHNPSNIDLLLKNNLEYGLQGILKIIEIENFNCHQLSYQIDLKGKEEKNVAVGIKDLSTRGLLSFKCEIEYTTINTDSVAFSSKTETTLLEIPLITIDGQYIVLNQKTREELVIYNGFNKYSCLLRGGELHFHLEGSNFAQEQSLGPPFGFDEFSRLIYDWEIEESESKKKLTLIGKSLERPGLSLVKEITFFTSSPLVHVKISLINDSDNNYSQLEMRSNMYIRNNPHGLVHYIPIDESIVRFDVVVAPRGVTDIGTDPARFHESWIATVDHSTNTVSGCLWQHDDKLKEIRSSTSNFLSLDIAAGIGPRLEKNITDFWLYCGPGSWKTIQQIWHKTVAPKRSKKEYLTPVRDIFDVEIIECKPIEGKEYELTIKMTTVLLMGIQGVVTCNSEAVTFSTNNIDFNVLKDEPFSFTTRFNSKNQVSGSEIKLNILLTSINASISLATSFTLPFATDLSKKIISRTKEEGYECYKWNHPLFQAVSVPDYSAGFVSMINQQDIPVLRKAFPEVKPSVFIPKDLGGIHFSCAEDTNQIIIGKSIISYKAREIKEDDRQGLVFTPNVDKLPPEIPDIASEYYILVHPTTNDILFRMKFQNDSSAFKKFTAAMMFSPDISGGLEAKFQKEGKDYTIPLPKTDKPRQVLTLSDIASPIQLESNEWTLSVIPPDNYLTIGLYADIQPVFFIIVIIIPIELNVGEEITIDFITRLSDK